MTVYDLRKSFWERFDREISREAAAEWLKSVWEELPPFPRDNYVEVDDQHGTYKFGSRTYSQKSSFLKRHTPVYLYAMPQKCIGSSWLYRDGFDGGKTAFEDLLDELCRIGTEIPAIPAGFLGDFYLCASNDLRVYAYYLTGRNVKLIVDAKYVQMADPPRPKCHSAGTG